MGNQQPSTYGSLTDAVVNARLGDGHFWRHPECKNSKIIWSSIHEEWVRWKQGALLPPELRGSVHRRDRSADRSFPNAKPIWTATSRVHPLFTAAHQQLTCFDAVSMLSGRGVGMWYLDDGCAVLRTDNTRKSYRVTLSLGSELSSQPGFILAWAGDYFGTARPGSTGKNNSRASARNKIWRIPKPIAIQIFAQARSIAPTSMLYKTPMW